MKTYAWPGGLENFFGGALRQAGVVAASAIYAVENNIQRLEVDHQNAMAFAEALTKIDGIRIDPHEVETNLVFFEMDPQLGNATELVAKVSEKGVKIGASGPYRLRACTHLDVNRNQVLEVADVIRQCVNSGRFAQQAVSAAGPYARG